METWKERGKYFLKEMKDPYYKGVPGEYAFFLMMSVIPLLIITAQVLAFFSLSMDVFEEFIGEPTFQLKEILAPVLQFGSVKSLGVMSLLSTLWAASKMQFSMIRVNRYAFGLKEKYFGTPDRPTPNCSAPPSPPPSAWPPTWAAAACPCRRSRRASTAGTGTTSQ